MEEKLLRFLRSHHVSLDRKNVMVAVSGGPDSVALLHLFSKWRKLADFSLYAVTFDHQLRPEAKEDVAYVEKLCSDWEIPLEIERLNVREFQKKYKVSTQVAARKLRYEAFAELMKKYDIDYLALGHHGDDQIETMVMALMRTTNLASLSGIPFRRPFATGEIIRPLLAVTKAEIEQYLKRHDLTYRIDRSNEDVAYMRNFVRKFIVPKMKEKNQSLHVTVQRLAETLQEDESFLRSEAKRLFERIVRCAKDEKKATIEVADLLAHPVPLQRRIYRLTLDYLYETDIPQLTYAHEQSFLELLREDVANKMLHFPNDLIIETSYRTIHFYFKKEKDEPFFTSVENIPATIPLPDGGVMDITYTDRDESKLNNEYICALSQIDLPLTIRTRKPGDRMRYPGLNGSKKIKDILIDEKIPRQKRDEIFLVEDANGQILWLVGIRKGLLHKRPDETGLYVSFHYRKDKEEDMNA